MLYTLLKLPAKLAFLIWCRHLRVNKKEILKSDGPLLIAANHPNLFLDAVLICTVFKKPVYSLARGDAFSNKFYNRLLRSLNMFPVYRMSEGAENLGRNYGTFDDCLEVFKKSGIVLIFSEGESLNGWNMRALKKGTARLALNAWEKNIPLQIIPLGINYSSFTLFGKNIELNFGEVITEQNAGFIIGDRYGSKIQKLNGILKAQLDKAVVQIHSPDKKQIRERFAIPVSLLKKILLFIPATAGYILHAPLYLPLQKFAFKKFSKIDAFDSVLTGMLFIFYPFYLILSSLLLLYFFCTPWCTAVFLIMPFTAWCYVQLKKQV